jgi:hypothetical protein
MHKLACFSFPPYMFYSPHKSLFPAVRISRRNFDVACCIVTAGVLCFLGVPVYDMDKETD